MDIWHPENLREEDLPDLPLEELDDGQLRQLLDQIAVIYAEVEAEEPDLSAYTDPVQAEEDYAVWEERLEALDDLSDEIYDLLEE